MIFGRWEDKDERREELSDSATYSSYVSNLEVARLGHIRGEDDLELSFGGGKIDEALSLGESGSLSIRAGCSEGGELRGDTGVSAK